MCVFVYPFKYKIYFCLEIFLLLQNEHIKKIRCKLAKFYLNERSVLRQKPIMNHTGRVVRRR
uniref:Uncharacterized protein n=1 Tax=Daphnia magna TaxID=35525 RepID=A0A0P6AYX3_9CRUS